MDAATRASMEQLALRSTNSRLLESTYAAGACGGFCTDSVLFPALQVALKKTAASSPPSSTMSMDTCYPKCMDEEEQLLLLRTQTEETSDKKTIDSKLCGVEKGTTMLTFDLEELGPASASQTSQQQEKSIVVDYEDSDGDHVEPRDEAATCAPGACGPLTDEAATIDSSRGRLARRRSRCSSSEMANLRGKSVIFQHDSITGSSEPDAEEEMRCSKVHKLCMCEVKLHRSLESCWLVSSGQVYDVTGLVTAHPGGIRSILRKAGGPDCARDMKFHTKKARKMMEKCFIGKLEQCGDDADCISEANCSVM